MYKKISCLVALLLLFTGCASNSNNTKKNVIKDEITCSVEDNNFTLMLEDGQIVKYIDSVDGELGQETVNILNEEHLVGITSNDEALKIMDEALNDLDGHCERIFEQE